MRKTRCPRRLRSVLIPQLMLFLLGLALLADGSGLYNPVFALETPSTPLQSPASREAGVRAKALVRVIASGAARTYDRQARQLVNAIFAHLDEFQLPNLGITSNTVLTALDREDVGYRLGGIARVVWKDWSQIARSRGVNAWSADPSNVGLSPFRQLIVKMIQGRQGRLRDYQQHGIYNLLTREEDLSVWLTEMDGVIAAVNRESFQWP